MIQIPNYNIKVKKLREDAVIPEKSHAGDMCYDLTLTHKIESYPLLNAEMWGTGLSIELPVGFGALMFARSSIYKTGYMLANGVGVIDNYRGEWKAIFIKTAPNFMCLESQKVRRLLQFMIVPIYEVAKVLQVNELSQTVRGEGGFGSTGE